MCATVRKRTRWKCCQGQTNGIVPIGNFEWSIFFPSYVNVLQIYYCVSSRVESKTILGQRILAHQKRRLLWKTTSGGDWKIGPAQWAEGSVALGWQVSTRSSCSSDENSTITSVSGICMRVSKQVSSPLSHVTRAPGETPGVEASPELDVNESMKRLLSCPLKP